MYLETGVITPATEAFQAGLQDRHGDTELWAADTGVLASGRIPFQLKCHSSQGQFSLSQAYCVRKAFLWARDFGHMGQCQEQLTINKVITSSKELLLEHSGWLWNRPRCFEFPPSSPGDSCKLSLAFQKCLELFLK